MEEDGDGEGPTPFWVQTPTNLRGADRLHRLFYSSGLLVFLLLVTAVLLLLFVVPSTISFSANIFRPTSVRRSWDSFNIVLVLAAVVFGFLSRNRNEERFSSAYDDSQPSPVKESEPQKSNPSTQNQSYVYEDYQPGFEQKSLILRRSSGVYADSTNGDYQNRFLDDFCVDSGRGMDPWQLHRRRNRSLGRVDYLRPPPQGKTVVVDTLLCESTEAKDLPEALSSTPLPELVIESPAGDEEIAEYGSLEVREEKSSRRFSEDVEMLNPISAVKPPLPSAEEFPPPESQESQRRSNGRAGRKKGRSSRRQNKDGEPTNPMATPPPQPPPTSPPPPLQQQKSSKSENRRGGGTGSSTKDFLNSLYLKKKKKQRQKSVDNVDSLLQEAQLPLSFQSPPPSHPPPPPPQPSVFHNLFSSKKQKRKRTTTVTLDHRPPSPAPAPPRAAAREPEPTSQATPLLNHKPPTPVMINTSDRLDEASNSGGESPFNRIPPPPPPPPPSFLKNPASKFVVQGDYIRVNSSRSGSPDHDEADSSVAPSAPHGGDAAAFHRAQLFCPSPDVNTKAANFITNFRAKLNLEKIHSTTKREVRPSSLGPAPNSI